MSHVRYMERTKSYYLSQGYDKPYRWAHFDDAPFAALRKPLAECRVALISTSKISVRTWEDQRSPLEKGEAGNVYSVPVDTPLEDLYSQSKSYDTHATHLEDVNSYFPLTRLRELGDEGRFSSLSPSAYCIYTAYSQRKVREADAPEVLRRCREDGVDAAVLIPL